MSSRLTAQAHQLLAEAQKDVAEAEAALAVESAQTPATTTIDAASNLSYGPTTRNSTGA
jgi:hypothetical protein